MTEFEPKDPDFEAKVMDVFSRQRTMATLGITVTKLSPGAIELRLPYNDAYSQQHDFLHGGIVATLLDTAAGLAALSLMPKGAEILTVEFKVNLMAPAKGEAFAFLGRVVRPGRTITVSAAEAFAL